jgi:hypothetical protein
MLEEGGCTAVAAAGGYHRTTIEVGTAILQAVYRSCGTWEEHY